MKTTFNNISRCASTCALTTCSCESNCPGAACTCGCNCNTLGKH